jgi:hypothetical protein
MATTPPTIYNNDLTGKHHDMSVIEHNWDHLSTRLVLKTQKLTADFCVSYVYYMDAESGSEDSYLYDKAYILSYQTHITEEEWDEVFALYY